jgi:hypothetical protein
LIPAVSINYHQIITDVMGGEMGVKRREMLE